MKMSICSNFKRNSLVATAVFCLLGQNSLTLAAEEAATENRPAETHPTETENANSVAPQSETKPKGQPTLLKGEVTFAIPKGTPLKLKLATVPTHAIKMMDRDLDGELLPAKAGQIISARVSEDLYVDENKVIPEGTIFYGRVDKINAPKRVYRPGSVEMSFNRIVTPDGRVFAFRAQADNIKQSTAKSKAKGFGIVMSYAAGGAIVGALVAYQIFGLHETIAMHGYNIAGGAAAGALMASGYAIMRRGPVARLEPGDDLNLRIDTDLLMPVAVEPNRKAKAPHLAGLDVDIKKGRIVRDGLGGHILYVDAEINNESESTLSSIDVFLEDSNGNRTPLCTSSDDTADMLFTINPHSNEHLHLAFQVEYPKLKRQLIWYEHGTRTICLKQPLP
jgi:hypothetical protein